MSAEQLAGQLATQQGQQGLAAGQLTADTAAQLGQLGQQFGQMGIAGEEAAARLGLAGADQTGQMAQAAGQLGVAGGQLGMQGAGALQAAGQGLGALGSAYGQLGQTTAGLGELGQTMQLRDIDATTQLGAQQQAQEQAVLDAQRQTNLMQTYEPYQRAAFYGDILAGAPSSQMTLAQTTTPNPSVLNQAVGAAAAGVGTAGQLQ